MEDAFVILSEAKNLALILFTKEILHYAEFILSASKGSVQNDKKILDEN